MTKVRDKSFQIDVATDAIAGILNRAGSAEAAEKLLGEGTLLPNLTRLHFVLDRLDVLEATAGADSPGMAVAAHVLARLAKPQEFIEVLAKILAVDPKHLANLVAGRLASGVYVGKGEFAARAADLQPQRKVLGEAQLLAMRSIADQLNDLGLENAAARAREFVARYSAITSAAVVYEPRSIPELYKNFGGHILAHMRRPVRLSALPNELSAATRERFFEVARALFAEISSRGLSSETSVLAGFAEDGVSGVLYAAAAAHDEIQRDGIADATIVERKPAFIDRGTVFGTKARDAEPLFDDIAATSMLVAVAPESAERERILRHCKQGGVAIVLHEGSEPDPALRVRGVMQLSLERPSEEIADKAIAYVVAKNAERNQQAFVSLAEHLAIGQAPTEINEVRQWARRSSAKFRIVRLQNQALDKLAKAYPDASARELTEWVFQIGRNVARYTHGIDNFKSNAEWRKQASAAVLACDDKVAALARELEVDVLFASWFGIQELAAPPSFFDEHAADLAFPAELDALSGTSEHTFDRSKYTDVRLGFAPEFLNARDSRPEVFLGSREEMMLYYRARGYEYDVQAHETNGTKFEIFRSVDASMPAVMVLQGIDSESRLLQVASLMRVAGVDPRRCIVRGTMERLRESNCSLLEARLMELTTSGDKVLDVAGVVIGNRQECFQAIADAAGVEVDKLEITSYPAGPYELRAVKVRMAGAPEDAPPSLFLAFKPAYGELTYDLGKVLRRVTSHQTDKVRILNASAGGSLDANDKVAAAHLVTNFVFGDQVFSLDGSGPEGALRPAHLELMRLQGVETRDAVNVFSPTPLEQTRAWLAATLGRLTPFGKVGNTDQELSALIAGLAYDDPRRPAGPCTYAIASTLVQSDVVGSGGLAASTSDKACSDKVLVIAKAFAQQGGFSGVSIGDGFAAVDGAQGEGARATRASIGAAALERAKVLPNFETMIATWKSSAEQLKGQKASYRMLAETFGPDEEEFLSLLFTGTNPADLWVTVDAADRHNEKIRETGKSYDGAAAQHTKKLREFARKYRFENVVLALASELPSIRGSADIILSYDNERGGEDGKLGKLDVIDRLGADGHADEDPNYALSHSIVLGAVAPKPVKPSGLSFEPTDELIDRFIDVLDQVHESVGGSEQDPRKKAALLLEKRDELVMPLLVERCRGELYEVQASDDPQATTRLLFDAAIERAQANHYVYTGGLDRAGKVSLVARLRRELNMPFEGGVRMFGDGLTYRFPGLKRAITERSNAWLRQGHIKPLPARTGETAVATPRFHALDNLDDFFRVAGTDAYRSPRWICGPSRLAWDNLSRESRIALHLGVEVLAKLAEGEKDRIAPVTGGTKYGYEEVFHEVFTREGWHILGTLAQNSSVSEQKWEPDERLRHFTFTGINWYGVARLVAEYIVLRYEGKAINVGGGGIAAQQIALQQALNVEAWLMTGLAASPKGLREMQAKLQKDADKKAGGPGKAAPVTLTDEQKRWAAGASNEMGERFPARAFDTFDALCEQFGATVKLDALKKRLGIEGQISTMDVEPLARHLGIDVDAIAKRYPADA